MPTGSRDLIAAEAKTPARKGGTQGSKGRRGRPITPVNSIDLLTGLKVKRFPSQKIAADTLGISYAYISLCCRGIRPHAGGFGWQYASGKMFDIQKNSVILLNLANYKLIFDTSDNTYAD